MSLLIENIVSHVVIFCAPGQYLQLSTISKTFKKVIDNSYYIATTTISLDNLEWAVQQGYVLSQSMVFKLAKSGDQQLLDDLWESAHVAQICAGAAKSGNFELFKWAAYKGRCEWFEMSAFYAAKGGHMDILEYMDGYYDVKKVFFGAARGSQMRVLKWLRLKHPYETFFHAFEALRYAGEGGSIKVLEWLFSFGEIVHDHAFMACIGAARKGYLDLIKWINENEADWWSSSMLADAIVGGHFHIVKWAYENGYFDAAEWVKNICHNALNSKNFEMFKWSIELGALWPRHPLLISNCGDIPMLEWALEKGCCKLEWFALSSICVVKCSGDFELLKWLHAKGCRLVGLCGEAAAKGRLDILKWAREHGYPWSDMPCERAANNDRLVTLKWAYRHGCPWNVKCLDKYSSARIRNFIVKEGLLN